MLQKQEFFIPTTISPHIESPGTQIQYANYGNTFWPQFIKKYKIASSLFCGTTISKLILRQWVLVILFASTENLGLGRAMYLSWCLSWINKKENRRPISSWPQGLSQADSFGLTSPGLMLGLCAWRRESKNHWIRELPSFVSCPWFRPKGFSSWWGPEMILVFFLDFPAQCPTEKGVFHPQPILDESAELGP